MTVFEQSPLADLEVVWDATQKLGGKQRRLAPLRLGVKRGLPVFRRSGAPGNDAINCGGELSGFYFVKIDTFLSDPASEDGKELQERRSTLMSEAAQR